MTKWTMRIALILVLIASSSATMTRTSSLRVASIPVAQAPEVRPAVQSFSIRLDRPARIGLPIWVRADLQGTLTARYPFGEDARFFGSNRLDLTRDGQTLAPIRPNSVHMKGGTIIGSIAPQSSPQNRLPLHLGFLIDRPGRYSVRWTVVGLDPGGTASSRREEILAQSNWLDFTVIRTATGSREIWLRRLLATRPTDAGEYVGDYLPSLLAAMPDRRVAQAMIEGTFSPVGVIASCSLYGLVAFPAEVSVPVTLETLRRRGSNYNLAHFVAWRRAWFQDRRDEIVRAAVSFLDSGDDAVAAGALQLLGFARAFDWRNEDTAMREADRAVEAAAPGLTARGGSVGRALAVYLPGIKSETARDRLWQQIEQQPEARGQALIALTWMADSRDLPRLVDLLIRSSNRDAQRDDLSGLPSQLMRAYGDAAVPQLQRILVGAESVRVKVAAAQELAGKGREEALRFFIDAIGAHRFYRDEVEGWMRETYRLPAGLTDVELIAFLNERIRNPQPAAVRESPARDAVAKLHSPNSADRKAAAKVLLDLAPQSPLAMNFVTAPLIDDVIRQLDLVNPDTWFDAAIILGRLGQPAGLEQYLERDGATAALIEVGDKAVPVVRDVLRVGGPTRRRLAAEVLGAIGGAAARDALTTALTSEFDANVKRTIQTALGQLGQRPPRAEIR